VWASLLLLHFPFSFPSHGSNMVAPVVSAAIVLATVPVLDPAGFIDLRGNGLTPSKIDDFLSEPSL